MRIISGRQRATKLSSPEGETTRPTSDRARESLFSILSSGKWQDILKQGRIADIYAGTGSFGLEALSRGASFCSFIETDKNALDCLRQNIENCHQRINTRVVTQSALHPAKATLPYDVVFIDPPYGKDLSGQTLDVLVQANWIDHDSLIIVQMHPKEDLDLADTYRGIDERRYGAGKFLFLELI